MISLDRAEALRYLGYSGQSLEGDLEQRFDEAIFACEHEVTPRSVHAFFGIDQAQSSEQRVVLANCGLVLEGYDIARHVKGACEVALMACTLGDACERTLRRLAATSPTDALLFDAASSALVEAVANAEEASVVQEAAERGLHTNCRFSPGYGDFPLAVQPQFLAVLDAGRRIGLSATRDYLLVPRKSVTAVVGVFSEGVSGEAVRSSCSLCSLRECCELRLKGGACHG